MTGSIHSTVFRLGAVPSGLPFAAMSPGAFSAAFVIGMSALIVAGGVWLRRSDRDRPGRRGR